MKLKRKLILLLSMMGLAMAFATISLIPEEIEIYFWLVIFAINSLAIAKVCKRDFFWNGFFVSIANCAWLTAVHLVYYHEYNLNHPDMAALGSHIEYFSHHERHLMLAKSPFYAVMFGTAQGIFSYVSAWLFKRRRRKASQVFQTA